MSMDEQNPGNQMPASQQAGSMGAADQAPAAEQDNPELDAKVLEHLGGDKAKFDALTEPEFQAIAEQLNAESAGASHSLAGVPMEVSASAPANKVVVHPEVAAAIEASALQSFLDPAGQLASASALLELQGRVASLEQQMKHVLLRLEKHGIVRE